MKRTALNRRGKRTKAWDTERRRLTAKAAATGLTTCEARYEGCWIDNALSWAHPRKRRHLQSGELGVAALVCIPCHDKIERLSPAEMYTTVMDLIAARETI